MILCVLGLMNSAASNPITKQAECINSTSTDQLIHSGIKAARSIITKKLQEFPENIATDNIFKLTLIKDILKTRNDSIVILLEILLADIGHVQEDQALLSFAGDTIKDIQV